MGKEIASSEVLDKAREIMESFDDSVACTVGYDEENYTLTGAQMSTIAGALYLAECEIGTLNSRIEELEAIIAQK